MSRRRLLLILFVVLLVGGGAWYAAARANLSALETPGRVETYLATQAKRWLVARAVAHGPIPPEQASEPVSVANGTMQYGGSCATCHGQDGRKPTRLGESMYPPVPSLASPDVQRYSNAELFVVIKHGIRLSGMPGFGRIHSDKEIWDLVHYLRSLAPPPGAGAAPPDAGTSELARRN